MLSAAAANSEKLKSSRRKQKLTYLEMYSSSAHLFRLYETNGWGFEILSPDGLQKEVFLMEFP